MRPLDTWVEPPESGNAENMTPDDRPGEEPTKPLPVEPDHTPPGPNTPVVAAHVPVADVATAPLDAVPGMGTRPARPRALTGALIASVAVLGIAVIVVLSSYVQGQVPIPALTPIPSPSSSITLTPGTTDVPAPSDPPSDQPGDPTPEPTSTPLPTDPPPDPTPTPTPAG